MAIRAASINVNGLLNNRTCFELLSFCSREKISILLLQERHFSNIHDVSKFNSLFHTNNCFFSFGTNKSRGVCIVILNLNINVKHFYLESPLSMMERTLKVTVAGTNPEQSLSLSKWRSSEERMLRKWSQCGRWSDKTPGMLLFRPPRLWTIMMVKPFRAPGEDARFTSTHFTGSQ